MLDDLVIWSIVVGGFLIALAVAALILERAERRHRRTHPTLSSPDRPRPVSLPAVSTWQAERQRRAFDDAMARMRVELDHDRKVAATLERLNVRTEDEMPRRSER